ncbi:ribonuclease III [Rhodobacteraceae bacterium XHP0102]|nr:ribonuclease III [Rhodobacteraceae bacterium XHP0102]
MKLSREITEFSSRLGYRFTQPELILRALTHASLSSPTRADNQRLEFLGDRVLGLVIAELLLEMDQHAPEGQLAPRFNALVRKETCADVARDIDLGAVLKLGKSEMMTGGRRKDALLGDAMEAVIAAVYLDGGYDAVRAIIRHHWAGKVDTVAEDARDAKTALQEWAQAQGQGLPRYVELRREGPDHAPVFTVEVSLASGARAEASAKAKRHAEQEAAKKLLAVLEADRA